MKTVVDSSRSRWVTRIKRPRQQPNGRKLCWPPQFGPASDSATSSSTTPSSGFFPLVISRKKSGGRHQLGPKYIRVRKVTFNIMDDEEETETSSTNTDSEDIEENNLDYIPMKPYNRTNRSRSLPFIRQATLNSALMKSTKNTSPPTLKVKSNQYLSSGYA